MVGEKLVPLALVMAAHFGEPVSDAKEVSLRAGAIPDNTTASTEWGIFGSGMNGLLAELRPLLLAE